jgi:hypothetical protein
VVGFSQQPSREEAERVRDSWEPLLARYLADYEWRIEPPKISEIRSQ